MGVSIIGLSSFHDDAQGADRGKNTIYVFEIDEMRICHLGDLGHTLNEKLVEEIGDIDILMIPTGGEYTINSETAVAVVQGIEPRIIIPMHYGEGAESTPGKALKTFLKEAGEEKLTSVDKLTLKKKDLEGKEAEVIVLQSNT